MASLKTIVLGAGVVGLALGAVWWFTGNLPFVPGSRQTYTIQITSAGTDAAQPPSLPDISGFTLQHVEAMLPEIAPGAASVELMEDNYGHLPTHDWHFQYAQRQKAKDARVIKINSGVYNLHSLYETIADPRYLKKTTTGYQLMVPIYIGTGSTLIINGQDSALRLAADTGAFISSMGTFYAVNTSLTGWNTEENTPATFRQKDTFRPYLVFWNKSRTYIAGTSISHMGYDAAKAYGITFSTSSALTKQNPDAAWPTGWIVDSHVKNLYYGLYSYEAEDLAVVGNHYKDNIIYAIDPHDRSQRLIIARNETEGTHKKHGIIVSREVQHSWIFDNHSHHNEGAGIMIERNSAHNVVAFNKIHDNNGDGLSFYESPHNLSWQNTIYNNAKSGIRIRNSMDITLRKDRLHENGSFGLEAYTASLHKQEERDLVLDPYEQRISFDIADSEFSGNKAGQIKVDNAESARFQELKIFRIVSGLLEGDIETQEQYLFSAMTTPGSAVTLQRKP